MEANGGERRLYWRRLEAMMEAMMEAGHHDIKVSIQRVDQVLEPRVHRAAPRIPPAKGAVRKFRADSSHGERQWGLHTMPCSAYA